MNRRSAASLCAVMLVTLVAPRPVSAQGQTPAQSELIAKVRAATARYHDRAMAVNDGYRVIGPDVPSMGEHWINVSMLLSGQIDPTRPPVLEYVTIGGKTVLAGVAYAVLVDSGATPPGSFPVSAAAWHYHAGTVDEESFILSHGHAGEGDPSGPRIAVLHLWAWLDNPAGAFATDNWALPWLRLGWPPPLAPAEDMVGRAVALAAGGEGYFAAVVNAMAHPDSTGRLSVREVFARAKSDIQDSLGLRLPGAPAPNAQQLAAGARRWEAAWNEALETVHHH